MQPIIENYRFKYEARGKWVFVPSMLGARRAEHVLRFLRRNVEFPDYYFHYQPGGHVTALHNHLKNKYFFRVDIRNFFYSISRNRVQRALASVGMAGAPTYAKWSTVRSPYEGGPRYALPIGFWQSPSLASLVLMRSPVNEAIEALRAEDIAVSVYLDDIVGSFTEEKPLRQAYDKICQACISANLAPNDSKLIPPSKAIVAFNCDLSEGMANVTNERIEKFFATEPSGSAFRAFEAYIDRVARQNKE